MTENHLPIKVPLSFAGLGAIFYGIKMFGLANGNMTTAQVIAVNVDFLPTIAAMLINIAPALVLPVLAYVLYRLRHLAIDDGDSQILLFFITIAGLAAVFYSSLVTLALCILTLLLHGLYILSQKKNWKKSFAWARFRPDWALQLVVSLSIPAIIISPSWIAAESAEIGGQQRVISVVKETGEYLFYLDKASNRVIYAKPSDLSKRAFCGSNEVYTVFSLMQYVASGPTYPRCPKVDG
jgi:hypothetical protein